MTYAVSSGIEVCVLVV